MKTKENHMQILKTGKQAYLEFCDKLIATNIQIFYKYTNLVTITFKFLQSIRKHFSG